MTPPDIRHALNQHACRGGKTARRRQVRRVEQFVKWCGCPPAQIGKRHVNEFLEVKKYSKSTTRDYWYAIDLLWRITKRKGQPPKPNYLR